MNQIAAVRPREAGWGLWLCVSILLHGAVAASVWSSWQWHASSDPVVQAPLAIELAPMTTSQEMPQNQAPPGPKQITSVAPEPPAGSR